MQVRNELRTRRWNGVEHDWSMLERKKSIDELAWALHN
jgi:hypothetical protein